MEHLSEFDHAEEDVTILPQGSHFPDRVFLSQVEERKLVCKLITDCITTDEFLNSPEIESENEALVCELVEDITARFPGQIPKIYKRFLANISKPTSVAGLLQCTGPVALHYLSDFANQSLDLRHFSNRDKLEIIAREFPAFWPILLDILNQEKTNFMNPILTAIVKQLLEIR